MSIGTHTVVSCRGYLRHALRCRLIPKAGAGPALRSDGGREIDEYLMRLLRIGAASDLEARVYTEVLHRVSQGLASPHSVLFSDVAPYR